MYYGCPVSHSSSRRHNEDKFQFENRESRLSRFVHCPRSADDTGGTQPCPHRWATIQQYRFPNNILHQIPTVSTATIPRTEDRMAVSVTNAVVSSLLSLLSNPKPSVIFWCRFTLVCFHTIILRPRDTSSQISFQATPCFVACGE